MSKITTNYIIYQDVLLLCFITLEELDAKSKRWMDCRENTE